MRSIYMADYSPANISKYNQMRDATDDQLVALYNAAPKWRSDVGKGWIVGKYDSSLFNAFLAPNSIYPNIYVSNYGFFAARSAHAAREPHPGVRRRRAGDRDAARGHRPLRALQDGTAGNVAMVNEEP